MLLFWRIRYFDRRERKFRNRDLFLDTATLPAAKRAAVELLAESEGWRNNREFCRFKPLFTEDDLSNWIGKFGQGLGRTISFSIADYLEDETGREIPQQELGPLVTGNPNAIMVRGHVRPHDIEYMGAEMPPVPDASVVATEDEIQLLGNFVRDFEELRDSALMKDGPGTVSAGGMLPVLPNGDFHFKTAVSDDEIRSFVTIFRRLCMEKEPANLAKTVALFDRLLNGHPLSRWVVGCLDEHKRYLSSIPEDCSQRTDMQVSFTVKRLIDVFMYTQYLHQPSKDRQHQYRECLQQVGGRRNFLTWLFLTELWTCALEICNIGRVIAGWFRHYCDLHGINPDVLDSLRNIHPGLGTAERKADREARLFAESVEMLALQLWEQAGKPEGGTTHFRDIARHQLMHELQGRGDGAKAGNYCEEPV